MHTLIRPIITEKSMRDVNAGKFTFAVGRFADKPAIKKAVEKKFGVDVLTVSTMIVKGRTMRIGKRRNEVTKSSWKKAVVKLKEGQKIDLFDVGA